MYLSDVTVTNISDSFTHKMAAKTSWHRYGTKLRHCHPMYRRLLYMVGLIIPSATTSGWTPFPTSYCNCEIQDGVQDGCRGYVSTSKKHPHSIFPIIQSNVSRFSIFFILPYRSTTFHSKPVNFLKAWGLPRR